ncbi:MAG: RAD55 family ATPase [archaeon]
MPLKTLMTKIDELLGGGLPEKSTFLLKGPPASKKESILFQFLHAGKKSGNPIAFVATDSSPAEIEKRAISLGLDLSSTKFVDCYSWALQQRSSSRPGDIIVPGPSSLNELSIAISRALSEINKPGVPSRVSFQSLSTLVLYNNPDIVFRFIQIMGARLKASGATTLFSIEEGMHEERVFTTLEHITDGTIEFKSENGADFLRIPRLPAGKPISNWIQFEATPYGIEIK